MKNFHSLAEGSYEPAKSHLNRPPNDQIFHAKLFKIENYYHMTLKHISPFCLDESRILIHSKYFLLSDAACRLICTNSAHAKNQLQKRDGRTSNKLRRQ